jgi:hypothetical protein
MNNRIQQILENIIPYLMLGVFIALFLALIYILSYIFVWGLIIGAVLWIFVAIKHYFLRNQLPAAKRKGRIIEHDHKK